MPLTFRDISDYFQCQRLGGKATLRVSPRVDLLISLPDVFGITLCP